jgi:hypothetical protein
MNYNFCLQTLSEIDWPLLKKYMGPKSFQIQMTGPKMWSVMNKFEILFNFFNKFFAKSQAAEQLHPHFAPPQD